MRQTTTAKVRLEAGKAARFSASARQLVGTSAAHTVRDLPLPKTPNGVTLAPQQPKSGECRMKRIRLVGTALLALTAFGSAARAVPFDFTFTGSLIDFKVLTTDCYQILALGAQGGSGSFAGNIGAGGRGAEIGGDFRLTAGEILQVAVGDAGGDGGGGGGGGGGSFVVGPGNVPLVIAGGGGGGGATQGIPLPGQGGLTGPDGGGSGGGTGGSGGAGSIFIGGGGGGGGFFSAGGSSPFGGATGGGAFPDLAGGSIGGGFGGGGGGLGGAGGGGGYSGGGGGIRGLMGNGSGGGGGSFDAGTDQILMADFQTGNGEVIITELSGAVPEPASIALLGAGLIGLAAISRRRWTERNCPDAKRLG
jgi:hypothetical protein